MSVTADFDIYPRKVVAGDSIKLFDKSTGSSETVISWTWLVDSWAFPGNTSQFPTVAVPAYTTAGNKTVRLTVTGSNGDSDYIEKTFYYSITAQTKPAMNTSYKDVTIFIYNSESATAINRNWSTDNRLFFTKLSYTNYVSKVPIAKFTVVDYGGATAAEKDLLLAGSVLNVKKDNYVAIIAGGTVVWSGKILRCTQELTGDFIPTRVSSWVIDCEGDIRRMSYQNVKEANKGEQSKPLGMIATLLCENAAVNTPYGYDINWNGDADKGVRSSEGIFIKYNIGDADMLAQFLALSGNSDFDWRTRLVCPRYTYYSFSTSSGNRFDLNTSTSPYATDELIGRWILVLGVSGGVVSYGLCTDNTTLWIKTATIANESSVPAGDGTLLIIMEPVLDIASDLSSPSKVASFKFNSVPLTDYSNGYGFNDKTDRSNLATKVIARGKSIGGDTIAATVAALEPWDEDTSCFVDTTGITHRTEGQILSFVDRHSALGTDLTLDGWGYLAVAGADYLAIKHPDTTGTWFAAQASTKINTLVETYDGNTRVTKININSYDYDDVYGPYQGGTAFIIRAADYANKYGRIYIGSPTNLGYSDAMDIYIAGETITTVADQLDTEYGYYLTYVCDGAAGHRDKTSEAMGAHGIGAIVWKGYNESSPDADSPVGIHGIILNTYATDQNVSIPTLEMYASLKLVACSYYYRKATFWCMFNELFKTDPGNGVTAASAVPVEVGDLILCLQSTTDLESDTMYGQPKNLWQVVSVSFDSSTMKFTVELGDFERNAFTQIVDKTAALNRVLT